MEVLVGFGEEIRTGRMFDDLVALSCAWATGFTLAVTLSVPLGLCSLFIPEPCRVITRS